MCFLVYFGFVRLSGVLGIYLKTAAEQFFPVLVFDDLVGQGVYARFLKFSSKPLLVGSP